jgi:hypothetical protein
MTRVIARGQFCAGVALMLATGCSSGGATGPTGGRPISAAAPGSAITTCTPPVAPVDVSHPTTVVGTGTAGSCTEAAFASALAAGGTITFDCGTAPVSILMTQQHLVTTNTVIDGGGLVTLDGGGAHGILAIRTYYNVTTLSLTVQNITLTHGHTTDVVNTTGLDSGGAAIFRLGGTLTVINSTLNDNHGPSSGQDVAGGAIYSIGGGPTTVVGSLFSGNSASNGGAIGNLGNDFTLVNSRLVGNRASGTGGNPGNGGNGGGISIDGQGTTITLCGDQLQSDTGNAFGGGIFRVAYLGTEPTIIDRTSIDSNVILSTTQGLAGGLYLQDTKITMTATTIANNAANGAGGFFVGPGATADLTNTTIAGNTAYTSLGGGLWLDASVHGTLLNVTIAGNHAPGSVAFDGGIAFGSTGVTLQNSIVADNTVGNGYNPINCGATLTDGGGNIQYPVARAGGGSDSPNSLCAAGVLIASPQLGPLGNNGGTTETLVPASGSPAIGIGRSCPSTDQRGVTRAANCTAGAVEVH